MGCKTKQKGDVTEAVVLAELTKRGFVVLLPFGDNQSYDLVVDLNSTFIRIQCKTGWLKSGSIAFKTVSTLPRSNGQQHVHRSYDGKADVFAIFCPQTDDVYIVPIDSAAKNTGNLRIQPTKNGQAKGVVWAKDFVLSENSFTKYNGS